MGSALRSLRRKQVLGTAASFMYRERFLIDKYSLNSNEPIPDLADVIDVDAVEESPRLDPPDARPNA